MPGAPEAAWPSTRHTGQAARGGALLWPSPLPLPPVVAHRQGRHTQKALQGCGVSCRSRHTHTGSTEKLASPQELVAVQVTSPESEGRSPATCSACPSGPVRMTLCRASRAMGRPPRCQATRGAGRPVARQVNLTVSPSVQERSGEVWRKWGARPASASGLRGGGIWGKVS
jgi:hypothetical protein